MKYRRNNEDKGFYLRSLGAGALALRFNKAGTKLEIEHDGGACIWGLRSGRLFETINNFTASAFKNLMLINKNPDSKALISGIVHTVYNHVTSSKRYCAEFLRWDDSFVESTDDGTLYVCNLMRVKQLYDWFDNECTFEQALLIDCCFETEIIRRLFTQREAEAPTFELDKFPWLQEYIASIPLEYHSVLSPYLPKNSQTAADGLGACIIV